MSDPDDDDDQFIEWIKELRSRKDSLEERLILLENREDFLKASLLNPIIESRRLSVVTQNNPSTSGSQHDLRNSLITVRNWVRVHTRKRSDVEALSKFEDSLNKAITWASISEPEEEDKIMVELLGHALRSALDNLQNLKTKEGEENAKEQLMDALREAIEWTSKGGENDEQMIESLAEYIIIASNWPKLEEEEEEEEESHEEDEKLETTSERSVDTLQAFDREQAARKELEQSLRTMYDWVKSITPRPQERGIHHELLDSLTIAIHWVQTGAATRDDEVMKQLLQEALLISLNWVIAVEDDEGGENSRLKLIDSLIFAINWATSEDSRGNDEVMRTLLRQALKTAMAWKKEMEQ